MAIITICKADPSGIAENETEDVVISITGKIPGKIQPFPRGPDLLSTADRFFDSEAQRLFEALRDSLPGGTIDRLLGKLLAYKASHFIVSHER